MTDDVEFWNDDSLRAVRIGFNGWPQDEPGVPDEVFLGPPGEQVAVLRLRDHWTVTGPVVHGESEEFDDFGAAFESALETLRTYFEKQNA